MHQVTLVIREASLFLGRRGIWQYKAAPRCNGYNAADADSALAQTFLDAMGRGMGANLLAAVWTAELSLLLRSGKYSDRGCAVEGKRPDFFLASVRTAALSGAIHGRSRICTLERRSFDRRDRIHVRPAHLAADPVAQFVSCGHASAVALGDFAIGL